MLWWLLVVSQLWLPGLGDPPSNRYWLDSQIGSGFVMSAVEQAQVFTLQLQDAQAEDALLVAGAALALGKTSLYLISDRQQLPWFLREADQAFPRHVSIGDRPCHPGIEPGPLPTTGLVKQPVDSFIGCLMSRLTPDQYIDARTHLKAIRTSMQLYGGDQHPYCEGINVASSADFDSPAHALQLDMEALRKASDCVFYLYDGQSRPSGMWVELGAALAWEKDCLLLAPRREALPPSLRGSILPAHLRIVYYQDHAQLLRDLADPSQAPGLVAP